MQLKRMITMISRLQGLRRQVRVLSPMPPTQNPAVVIAPHPDDEIFGLGGLIALKRNSGTNVKVVYMTSGENVYGGEHDLAREDIAHAREGLARKAAGCVGVPEEDLTFLGYPDGSIPKSSSPEEYERAVADVAKAIVDSGALEVYAPHPLDFTPDHAATTAIVREAVKKVGPGCTLSYYCVWMWYRGQLGNAMARDGGRAFCVDLAGVRHRKHEAVRIYVDTRAPSGEPWSGYLSRLFVMGVMSKRELFFDAAIDTQNAV